MKQPILYGILLCIAICAFAKTDRQPTDWIQQDIAAMLPEGDILAVILDIKGSYGMRAFGRLSFSIGSDGQHIWFHTYDGHSLPTNMLDKVQINLKQNVVIIGEAELNYVGVKKVIINDRFDNKWQGYRWSFEGEKRYEFTLGRVESSGQTFMRIQINRIGNNISLLDLPLLF
ncbi:hypothetical protein ACFOET_09840 [Parapedobacter deserti]|uniref:Outer membrane lipoprotein-sorting protein n=1 Tax=Parapedobacter deserti TaxID=1912957 RepID=A0ABV7JIM3_9SPHI